MALRKPEEMPEKTPYLKGPDGYVYAWTDSLAKRTDMTPCHDVPASQNPNQEAPEAPVAKNNIKMMRKDDLIEFMAATYDFKLDPENNLNTLRHQARQIVDQHKEAAAALTAGNGED